MNNKLIQSHEHESVDPKDMPALEEESEWRRAKMIEWRDEAHKLATKIKELEEERNRLNLPVEADHQMDPKPSKEHKHQNHHHELTSEQTVVDFGTGEFVADNQRLPLLKALNECGLITRTHCYGHETGCSFVSILMKNDLRFEVKKMGTDDGGREINETELLLMWKRTD